MRQRWLQANRRALSLGLAVPLLLMLAGGILAGFAPSGAVGRGLSIAGWTALACGAVLTTVLVYFLWLPRLAYEDGFLLVYLNALAPTRVPIDVVECFFLGQAPSLIAGPDRKETETTTVVVRLAESATQWQKRDVRPILGHWCDGYITIRGTWCEPLTAERLTQLNANLREVHRARRAAQQEKTA